MMKNNENLNKQPHWRCRLCGHSTPLGQAVCSNPSCRADLGIYGEAVTPGKEDDGRSAWKQRQEEARQREYSQQQEEEARWKEQQEQQRRENAQQQEETQRQTAEEKRRRAEEKARRKADRRAGRSGGGTPKWLIPALAAVLVAALGIGAGVFFAGRSTAGNPVPPRSSAGPGPGSAQPGESGALESDTPGPDESRPGQAGTPAPDGWKGNVLMADPNLGDDDELDEYPVFGSAYPRENIASITFMDSLDDLHGSCWDVSQAQDGSVMAWVEDTRDGGMMFDLYIGAQGGVETPENCSFLFEGYSNARAISFNGAFHTENVTDMYCMFDCCEALQKLDLSGFDTSNVTDMAVMFQYCEGLTGLNVSSFDTSIVTDMSWMFYGCSGLSSLNITNFKTSNVTDMKCMFYECSGLAKLDVSSFDTSDVTDMAGMFYGCSGLAELDVSGFDTSNVTNMCSMFNNCSSLREVDVSSFDTSNVTDMSWMFYECSGLAELDITNFKTSNVKNMSHMFAGVNSGFALHFARANFDTSNVENYEGFMDDSFDWRKMFE